jgi:hypothetical protein
MNHRVHGGVPCILNRLNHLDIKDFSVYFCG